MFIDNDEILEDVKDEYKKFILDLINKIDLSYLGRVNFENKPELKIEQSEMKIKIYKILIPPLSQQKSKKLKLKMHFLTTTSGKRKEQKTIKFKK